jgi:predicted CopG family antitoxin
MLTVLTGMSHHVRLDDHVYERIKANKRDDESFSEAVERLIGGRSLRDLQDVFGDEQVDEMRDAIEDADDADREEVRDVAERFE